MLELLTVLALEHAAANPNMTKPANIICATGGLHVVGRSCARHETNSNCHLETTNSRHIPGSSLPSESCFSLHSVSTHVTTKGCEPAKSQDRRARGDHGCFEVAPCWTKIALSSLAKERAWPRSSSSKLFWTFGLTKCEDGHAFEPLVSE